MDDQELIEALRKRDPAGLTALMGQYEPLLRYILGPILPDPREAEECLSDIYLKIWDKIERYDPAKGRFSTWLTALARNTALNRARRKEQPTEDWETAQLPPQESAEDALLRKERQELLAAAVAQLSRGERLLFYRKYYYCQPSAQIAAELGLSTRAVEGRLYRLRQKLQRLLGGDFT